jgi:hypothetical protein
VLLAVGGEVQLQRVADTRVAVIADELIGNNGVGAVLEPHEWRGFKRMRQRLLRCNLLDDPQSQADSILSMANASDPHGWGGDNNRHASGELFP